MNFETENIEFKSRFTEEIYKHCHLQVFHFL